MTQVTIANTVTMTSVELVDYINSQRKESEAELRHRDFTAKVPKVLGEEMCEKFRTSLKDAYGRDQLGYRFPKREACLLAMSYSYELQAKVFDRMTELEQKNQTPAIPQTYSEALRLAADLVEQVALATEERDKAVATKALIGSKREATAMASASAATRKANKLEVELDQSKQYATVKRMEGAYKRKFNWRTLKAISAELNLPSLNVFDANYGSVKSYHAEVWRKAYEISPAAIATESLLS